MAFSDHLLEVGSDIWDAQKAHPFVVELAEGTLDEGAFRHWVEQDYRYLLDYARVFAIASTKADDEDTMTGLMGTAHTILAEEMDLHREFASEYGLTAADLETVEKAPTCVGYTNFLVRTAHEGSMPEIAAALYPCGKGYLDVAAHMADLASDDHQYTPFIETYTSEGFIEVVDWMTELVDRCAAENPGAHANMEDAFLTAARLEHAFWEMAYTQESWPV